MTDEMKLLRAFIEASGYDIKVIVNVKEGQTVVSKRAVYGNQTFADVEYKVTKKKIKIADNECAANERVRYDNYLSSLQECYVSGAMSFKDFTSDLKKLLKGKNEKI